MTAESLTKKEHEQIRNALITVRDMELSKINRISDKEKARKYKNQILATFTILLRKVKSHVKEED